MLTKLLTFYALCVSKRPRIVLAIVFIVVGLSSLYLPNFRLDASSDSLVLENDDDLRYYRQIRNKYSESDFLVVMFSPEKPLFSSEVIAIVRILSDKLEKLKGIKSVLSYLEMPLLFSPKKSMSELADNLKTIEDENIDLEMAKEEFKSSPLYSELLVSKDGKTTALQLNLIDNPKYDEAKQKQDTLRQQLLETGNPKTKEQLEEINSLILSLNNQETIDRDELVKKVRIILQESSEYGSLYLGGTAMIAADMISFIKSDLNYFSVGVLFLFILTLGTVFRRVRWVLLPLTCSGLVGLFIVGFLGWLDWRVTVVSSNFIALLLIVTISLTIHLIVRYQEIASREKDLEQNQLVSITVQEMFKPCLYTALTTIVAFASLSISDIKPVIDFGKMMVVGILFAFIFSFTVLPSIMSLLAKLASDSKKDFSKGFTLYFSSFTSKKGKTVLGLSVLLMIFSVTGINKLTVENRFIDYFKESTEIYRGMELLDLKLGGTAPLDIILEAPQSYFEQKEIKFEAEFEDDFGEDKVSDNGYWWNIISINRLEAVHDYIDSLPEVGKVLSIASGIKVAKELKNGEPISELDLALLKNLLPQDIKETLLSSYISQDENQVRIASRVLETSKGLKRNELLLEIENTLQNKFGFQESEYRLTGLAVLYNNMLQSLFSSQIATLGVVFISIMLMFLLLFRSLNLAIIGMVPNLLASGVVLGTMGWMKVPLDIMTITVAAISVGMAVDNTIHYLHRFKLEFKKTQNYELSMQNSHSTIGRAMSYTSMIIIIGFLVLVTSNFNPTVYFGLFVSLAMFMALMGALTLLPKLLIAFKPLGEEKS